eukprot:6323535-Prymnesium_polylepis.1
MTDFSLLTDLTRAVPHRWRSAGALAARDQPTKLFFNQEVRSSSLPHETMTRLDFRPQATH